MLRIFFVLFSFYSIVYIFFFLFFLFFFATLFDYLRPFSRQSSFSYRSIHTGRADLGIEEFVL